MLLNLVLGSLGIYYMSLFRMPNLVKKSILRRLEQLFWGDGEGDRKLHWVKWEIILANKQKVVSDIGSLEALTKYFLLK